MKISREFIAERARKLIEALQEARISSLSDLESLIDTEIQINAEENERVEFSLRSSNFNTQAYTVSYIIHGLGIPLEFKINPSLQYSQVIVKCHSLIEGYSPFAQDQQGNIAQNKIIPSNSLYQVKLELTSLARI